MTLGLLTSAPVALTSTVAAACAGESIVQLVSVFGLAGSQLVQLTEIAFGEPNLKVVDPLTKPVPVTVTLVPPAVEPSVGLTLVIVGKYLKRSAVEVAL